MYFALVHFPDIDYSPMDKIRKKYDPTFGIIDPHITLMFPVPYHEGEIKVRQHLKTVLKSVRPFTIHLSGFVKSWDHWLFLTLKEGKSEVNQLYEHIYSGVLSPYKRKDIEFIPHIGLGLFSKMNKRYDFLNPKEFDLDQKLYEKAIREAQALNLDYQSQFTTVSMLKLNHDLTKIFWRKDLPISYSNA